MFKEGNNNIDGDKVSQEEEKKILREKIRASIEELKKSIPESDFKSLDGKLGSLGFDDLKKVGEQIAQLKYEDARIKAEGNKKILFAMQGKVENPGYSLDDELNFV